MSRRQRVRFPAAVEVAGSAEPVAAIGPVIFTLTFGGIDRVVDLSEASCPRLVRPLAAALASIGGDDGAVRTYAPDFQQMTRHLRVFAQFCATHAGPGDDAGLADLTPALLEAFEAGLIVCYGETGSQVQAFMRTVIRLLRLAADAAPGVLTAVVQARLGYGTSTPLRRTRPLDAHPMPVLEAIQQAALADVRAIRDRIDAGEAAFITGAEVVPLLVTLICLTGLEPECAKSLRAGCLSSPSGGFATLAYDKKRARGRTARQMRIRTGGVPTPGGLIALVVRLTEPARQAAGTDALWVGSGSSGLRVFFDTGYELTARLRAWASHHRLHELTDHGGTGVRLDLRRIRKSVKSRLYLRSGGVLDDFATGHTKGVAASHYADIDAHREVHDQAVEDGLRQALSVALPAPVIAGIDGEPIAAPRTPGAEASCGGLTPAQHRAAVDAEQDVFLASCTGFHDSPSPAPLARPARSRSGDAWSAPTRCSPNAICPASSASPTSSPPSRRMRRDAMAGPLWRRPSTPDQRDPPRVRRGATTRSSPERHRQR
jgi:hypothetical protein